MGKNFPKYALLFSDLALIVIAFRIVYWLRNALQPFFAMMGKATFAAYWPAILLALGTWIILFRAFQLDSFYVLGWDLPLAVSRLLMALVAVMMALLAGSYMARAYYSRLALVFLPPVLLVLLVGNRLGYQAMLKWLRKYGWGMRRVVIVGQSELAQEIGDRIRHHEELNYELVGFLHPTVNRTHDHRPTMSIDSGNSDEMARALASRKVDELIFTTPIRRDTAVLEFIAHCQEQGIQVRLIPEYYDLHTQQIESFKIDGIPIFTLRESSLDPLSRLLKLAMDYSLAVVLLVLFSPVMLAIGIVLAVLRTDRILKPEGRVGLQGRPFNMYRFDVSSADAPQSREVVAAATKVRFCQFLHRYSLSELPQLLNVLKGDMSIVGPRPETPERVRHYSAWHLRRLQVRPGITGLAQVRGLRGLDPSDLKTKHDLEYVATFSPLLDLTLVVATMSTLLRRRKSPPPAQGTTSPPPRAETVHADLT